MNAIILAAGRGNRMGNLTHAQPKCLTSLAGKTLLDWQIEALSKAQILKIGLVRGYLPHLLSRDGLNYFENKRWAETNMVQSLCCASPWLESETCIISYSDIIYPKDTVVSLAKQAGDIVITYDLDWRKLWSLRFSDPLSDAETFRIDASDILLEIGNKATDIGQIQGQYMGLLKFTPSGWKSTIDLLNTMPKEKVDRMDMTTLLSGLIYSGVKIRTVPVHGCWYEIDNENDLRLYEGLIRMSESWINRVS